MPETSERIAELRRELESNPASRQFYQLGELLRREGRAAEATSVLRAGLGHHPKYVAAWVSLGRACLDRTMPRDAAKALHEALELDAHNPVAWRLLGEARLAEGDRFGALDAMQHALQLAPGDDVLRAAVDALASETWPPGESAPAPAGEGVARSAAAPAAAPVTEPPGEAVAPGAPPLETPSVIDGDAARPSAQPVPPGDPFAEIAPPLAAAAPAAGVASDDPFGAPALAAPAVDAADVFALPVAPPAFADVFALQATPSSTLGAFLPEFAAPDGATVETEAALAPLPAAPPLEPATARHAGAPAEEAEPVIVAAAEVSETVPPSAATEDLPAADLASTSAFAAAPLDLAAPLPLDEAPAAAAPAAAPEPSPAEPGEPPAPVAGPEPSRAVPAADAPGAAAAAPGVVAPAVAAAPVWAPPPVAASADERERRSAAARPTLTLARLHLQQQDFGAAIAILERVVADDPDNQEARDLLDLVHDMMAPLPGELPSLSVRERKIAALQGWLASLTLGHERMATR